MIARLFLLCAVVHCTITLAAEPAKTAAEPEVAAGHSYHGEAFDEGPRQAAVLIPGMAKIEFATSTKSAAAQSFIEQGISQLHGFWFLEAERSFRQAAKEDPDLAIAYWGMAMANVNNSERSRGLIDEAMKRREKNTSHREKLYIEALDRFIPKVKDDKKDAPKVGAKTKAKKDSDREAKKKRSEKYVSDLETILHEFPDDLEAKAFIVVHLWQASRYGVKMTSRYAVNALMSEIFAANPMHPVHHYRIHLWDSPRPDNALKSSAMCGPSSPGIAHMWHMPGHIYSKLKRYGDAAWQQEASARVDHAHMMRARLMPDQIHNFAHNNEWLIRNLLYIGRVNDALEQAQNLVSLPRHPKYNSLGKSGSFKYGRQRLLQTLTEYALWDELIKESGGHYLPPTNNKTAQAEWLGWLAVARFMTGDTEKGTRTLRSLRRRRLVLQQQKLDAADGGSKDDQDQSDDEDEKKPLTVAEIKKQIDSLKPFIARAAAAAAASRKDLDALNRHFKDAKLNSLMKARWLADAGDIAAALKLAESAARSGKNQVRPVAVLVDLLWRKGDQDEAKKRFEELRKLAGVADIDTPMLVKLKPVADAAGIEGDWRIPPEKASDLGERPPLDDLGPFRWQPYVAPSWEATLPDGELTASPQFDGRPRLMIFYLGFGCLHCVEQLHAFAPKLDEFRKLGVDVVAISTEDTEELNEGLKDFDKPISIPLLADPQHQVFKAFRCWDDFEDQPLHGTFLIDAQDRVRWQDISHEPFTEVDFMLEEAKRLLALP